MALKKGEHPDPAKTAALKAKVWDMSQRGYSKTEICKKLGLKPNEYHYVRYAKLIAFQKNGTAPEVEQPMAAKSVDATLDALKKLLKADFLPIEQRVSLAIEMIG